MRADPRVGQTAGKKAKSRRADCRQHIHYACHQSLHITGVEVLGHALPINGNAPETEVKKTDKVVSSVIQPSPHAPFLCFSPPEN